MCVQYIVHVCKKKNRNKYKKQLQKIEKEVGMEYEKVHKQG